jgi:hypothetical protein
MPLPIISWLVMGAVTAIGGILAKLGWKKVTGKDAVKLEGDK